jgi:hypothetical protein
MSRTVSAFSRGLSFILLTAMLLVASNVFAQSAGFTYQGRLTDQGAPANGQYDLSFKLLDAGGSLQGSPNTVTVSDVAVTNGVFTVQLNFGTNAFPGAERYLEISLRRVGEAEFTTLSPRQPITATPYANHSTLATTASNFSGGLSGDVTGTQSTTVVSSVGGVSASNVADGVAAANNATESSTPNTLVKRDASGNFSAGTITATLNGNATTATTATTATNSTNFSGALTGDVTGTQAATVVSNVGGQSASNVAAATALANGASETNTPNALVRRDASGNFSANNITANLNGNASTATTASNFSGTLAGDVTGTQNATAVNSVGGMSASSVVNGATAANNASNSNNANAIVKRDASGNFSANTITASLSGNATTATTATTANTATTATTASSVSSTAGDSVVTAINASSSTINAARVSGGLELAPLSQQTTSSTNHLINLKLVSTDPVNHKLGTPGANALISLSASGTYLDNSTHDKERFRVDNDGSILSVADYTGGVNTTAPVEGSGTRFMWYATKAALRAGQINGTQWDDANIGLYSVAFGQNVRALGDNSIVVGKNSVAANTGTVALGEGHTATGANSVALGYGASTSTINGSPRTGTFVFSDRSVPLTYTFNSTSPDIESQFHPTVTNSFNVRAVNGSFFYTNTALTTGFIFNSTTATMTLTNSKLSMASDGSTTLTSNSGGSAGVTLPAGGGSWNNLSDRNMKANFASVNPREILRGVLSLPISTWNYKSQDTSIRHIGPMAQDFFATFKLGEGNRTIATIDPDGVALAAIQGLNEELKDRDVKIESLQEQLKQQQTQIESLKKLVCLSHPNAEVCGK